MDLFWQQAHAVKLILLAQLALVLISAVRLLNWELRLYRYASERISPESVLKGEANPDLLADSAFANRLANAPLQKGAVSKARAGAEDVLQIVRVAGSRFLYFWERCQADVESARRASLLTFLLSLVVVAYNAYWVYFYYFYKSSDVPWGTFWTGEHLLVLLVYGLSCTAVLYFASSFFELALAKRRIGWNYFCARVTSELPLGGSESGGV
jgi:hypothetical protein